MNVIEFSYFDISDPHDVKRWPNYSRCYEYEWILSRLAEWPGGRRLHNTACGTWPLHKSFARALNDWDAVHTDIQGNHKYDITTKCSENFDVVLCISTLEHLSRERQALALKYLTDQLLSFGLLLCTFDAPPADLKLIEEYFGAKCADVDCRLNGFNGPIKQTGMKFNHNIVKLAAEKSY